MSRPAISDQSVEVRSLLSRLAETITHTDSDDLSGLAQLHGWCEALMGLKASGDSAVSEEMTQRAAKLTHDLEGLILGDVSSAAEAFANIAVEIQQLTTGLSTPGETSDLPAFAQTPVDVQPQPNSSLEDLTRDKDENSSASPAAYESVPLILNANELDFIKGFVEEAREHLEAIEAAVLEVERCPDDTARIDDLFRPFHTIKGIAGFLNLRDINCLTHEVETLLDQGRKGKRTVTTGIIDLVLAVVDLLKIQIADIDAWVFEPHSEPVFQPPVAEMINRLRAVVDGRLDPDEGIPPRQNSECSTRESSKVQASADGQVDTGCGVASPPTPAVSPLAQEAGRVEDGKRGGATGPSAPAPAVSSSVTATGDRSIRIDTEKLDSLIDMVGELVIAQTLVNMSEDVASNHRLARDVTQVTKIVRDVQELAMAMRMVPIGPTFQKMARLVRDVSRKAGKQVNLTISGEDTELDKTVIQEIGDPLVHMVRNAVDHGIERPDARREAGKPETGEVHLRAGHEGGNIVISIRDDGKGLDPEVLLAKGIEKGLVPPDAELSEQEIFALILAPGFSTAAQVTDISGRGVGMDVVKRNIEQLRGRVEIVSEKGAGTTFTIRLPLTLAIIDGLVIRAGSERFVLSTISIQQSLRPVPEAITSVHHRGEVLNVRGEMIPLIQLGVLFGLGEPINPCEAMVVIAHCEGRLVGLVVDELIGQQQVVIKTLGERFGKLQGVSGAAILGDGRVGLILEMSGLNAANEQMSKTSIQSRL